MRIPGPSSLQALRGRPSVGKAEVDALTKQAGADPAARAALALDVLALGGRLDADAAEFARSLLETPSVQAGSVDAPAALAKALQQDLAEAKDPAAATLALSAYAGQLASLTSDAGVRDQVAAELLGAASQSPAVGDPARAEGDPWSAAEWTEHASGWRGTPAWQRLVAILDARGLRPLSVPRDRPEPAAEGAWWSQLTAPSPLFRAAQAETIQSGEVSLSSVELADALAALGAQKVGAPLVTAAEVKAVFEG